MKDVYFALAAVSYGMFVIQFIASWFLGDLDIDADADFDVGDLVSFKGLIHFIMGFSGWILISDRVRELQWWDYGIAVVVGLLFVLVLYHLYKLCMKLQHDPPREEGLALVDKMGKIYVHTADGYIIQVEINGHLEELYVKSKTNKVYKPEERVRIMSYEDGEYFIY